MRSVSIYIFLFFAVNIFSQQLPYMSQLDQAKTYWNPANISLENSMNFDVFVRKQWIGFGGAPTTGFIHYQYPFVDYNMAAGGSVNFDRTGPLNKIGFQLNYAYKLKEALGEDSQLSIGITGGGTSYSLNASNAIVNETSDPLIGKALSGFAPTVGLGISYLSDTRGWRSDNAFYAGLAYNQIYETNLFINNLNQKRVSHIVFDLGTRIYGDDNYFEPSLQVNYVNPEIMHLLVGGKFEMKDKFWAGLGYSTINDVTLQGGLILPDIGGNGTQLRVGILANMGITSEVQNFGPGFEFFMRYALDMD